jgi:hypothetical protein
MVTSLTGMGQLTAMHGEPIAVGFAIPQPHARPAAEKLRMLVEITATIRHIDQMKEDPLPLMTPHKREDNSGWMIRVTWPDGPEELVNGFRSISDVESWLSVGSQEWLRQHPRNKND